MVGSIHGKEPRKSDTTLVTTSALKYGDKVLPSTKTKRLASTKAVGSHIFGYYWLLAKVKNRFVGSSCYNNGTRGKKLKYRPTTRDSMAYHMGPVMFYTSWVELAAHH